MRTGRGAVRALFAGTCCVGLLALAPAVGALARPAHAQELVGLVIDDGGRPIAEALVAIMDASRKVVASGQSGDDGTFSVTAPESGSYNVYVTKFGYRSLFDGLYDIVEGVGLEITAVMHALPFALEPLTAEGSGEIPRLERVGFYERKRTGMGTFIEREEIEQKVGAYITDAMRGIPRLRVQRSAPTFGGPGEFRTPELLLRSPKGYCSPTLFVDGIVAALGGSRDRSPPVRPDEHVHAWEDVEAIEVYTGPSEAPQQYTPPPGCGAVLIWTKHHIGRGP